MTQKGRFRMEFSKTNYIFIISDFPATFEALRGSADFSRFKSADFQFGSYFYHFWPKSQCGAFFPLNFCHWTRFCCRNQKIPRILEFFGIYGISPQIWHIWPFCPNKTLFPLKLKSQIRFWCQKGEIGKISLIWNLDSSDSKINSKLLESRKFLLFDIRIGPGTLI